MLWLPALALAVPNDNITGSQATGSTDMDFALRQHVRFFFVYRFGQIPELQDCHCCDCSNVVQRRRDRYCTFSNFVLPEEHPVEEVRLVYYCSECIDVPQVGEPNDPNWVAHPGLGSWIWTPETGWHQPLPLPPPVPLPHVGSEWCW